MKLCARITACDTLFLPDGRPFNQDDEGMAAAESVFPPMPNRLAACVRSTIATILGVSAPTLRKWQTDQIVDLETAGHLTIGEVVGDGDSWGGLRILRVWIVDSGNRRYLPAPLTLMNDHRTERQREYAVKSQPSDSPSTNFSSDIGVDFGYFTATEDLRPYTHHLLSDDDLTKLLDNPNSSLRAASVLDSKALFPLEAYVGLGLTPQKKQVPGRLYAAGHLRTRIDPENGRSSAFEVEFALDDNAAVVGSALVSASTQGCAPLTGVLGGRGRVVDIRFSETCARPNLLEAMDTAPSSGGLLIYAVAPLVVDSAYAAALRGAMPFLGCVGVRLTSAVMNRAQRFSAWDLDSHGRSAWVWMIPAGAVFACTVDDTEAERRLRKRLDEFGLNLMSDEDSRRYRIQGFGDCTIGMTPERNDDRSTT